MSFITRFCYRHFFKNTQRVKAHTAGNFDVRRRFEIRKKIAKFDVESTSNRCRNLNDFYWTSKKRWNSSENCDLRRLFDVTGRRKGVALEYTSTFVIAFTTFFNVKSVDVENVELTLKLRRLFKVESRCKCRKFVENTWICQHTL